MTLYDKLKAQISGIANINDHIDIDDASARIKSSIWFKGPNVWILAFSIVIASVGLNVNSTAVIIGAMLVSPLMGPIIGMGLSLGTNDTVLLRDAARNLLIMVIISLLASCLYFVLTPLNLTNPTELLARTSPTIYDVLIALFGGLAGILENCRKERGTVISGVAIATALMPPLCTAGYGLANLNMHYFLGAMYLFLINSVFIILATYIIVKYLRFPSVQYEDLSLGRKRKLIVTLLMLAFIVPSVISAVSLVRTNNFERKVQSFVSANRVFGRSYIYDYKILDGRTAEISLTGDQLDEAELTSLYSSAAEFGISRDHIVVNDHSVGVISNDYEKMFKGISRNNEELLAKKDARISELESQIEAEKRSEDEYVQITRELRYRYQDISDVSISRGLNIASENMDVSRRINVIAFTPQPLDQSIVSDIEGWLKVRMNDSTVVVMNIVR